MFMDKKIFKELVKNNKIQHIRDFPNYYITTSGLILTLNLKILKPQISYRGFKVINLYFNKKTFKKSLHLLIAQQFIKPYRYAIPGYRLVFKDGDKLNTKLDNLKWVKKSDLVKYSKIVYIYGGKKFKEGDVIPKTLMSYFTKNKEIKLLEFSDKYYVHKEGFIIEKNGYIKPTMVDNNYRRISLRVNGVDKKYFLHVLIAETFLRKKESHETVNHIDGNSFNNNLTNLEIIPHKENVIHAHKIGLVKREAKIKITDLCKNIDLEFYSLRDASRFLGISKTALLPRLLISDKYPIFGKYVIKIQNQEEFFKLEKARSKKIFAKDLLINKTYEFNSLSKASMVLGIPIFQQRIKTNLENYCVFKGFILSYKKEQLKQNLNIDKNFIKNERDKYYKKLNRTFVKERDQAIP